MCCKCGTPWGPGQTWKTSYRFQSRELWYGTSSQPLCQVLKPSNAFNFFTFQSHLKWTFTHSTCSNSFQTGFPFCFCVPALLAGVCARESECGLCSLQSIKEGGVEGLILRREKPHDRELIVQVSHIATGFYLFSHFMCTFSFVCDLSPVILGPQRVSGCMPQVCVGKLLRWTDCVYSKRVE